MMGVSEMSDHDALLKNMNIQSCNCYIVVDIQAASCAISFITCECEPMYCPHHDKKKAKCLTEIRN